MAGRAIPTLRVCLSRGPWLPYVQIPIPPPQYRLGRGGSRAGQQTTIPAFHSGLEARAPRRHRLARNFARRGFVQVPRRGVSNFCEHSCELASAAFWPGASLATLARLNSHPRSQLAGDNRDHDKHRNGKHIKVGHNLVVRASLRVVADNLCSKTHIITDFLTCILAVKAKYTERYTFPLFE